MTAEGTETTALGDGVETVLPLEKVAEMLGLIGQRTMGDRLGLAAAIAFAVNPTAFSDFDSSRKQWMKTDTDEEKADQFAQWTNGEACTEALRTAFTVIDLMEKITPDPDMLPRGFGCTSFKSFACGIATARMLAARTDQRIEPGTAAGNRTAA